MTDIVERLRAREVLSIEQDGYIHSLPINPDGDDGAAEIERLRAENEKLRRDVRTAVMGDSAELQDVKRENEKLREVLAAERERCAKIAEQVRDDTCDGPVAWSMADCIAAAIRESGE